MTVFISRELNAGGPFRNLLESAGHEVHGMSLIRLEPMLFAQPPQADWLFFASANAVSFFFNRQRAMHWPMPAPNIAALGPSTATAIEALGLSPDFRGTGDPEDTASAFAAVAAGQKVLFPAASHSRQSVQRLLAGLVDGLHWSVYDNRPIHSPPRSSAEVLVFTSPMNAINYLEHHVVLPGQSVVAIGNTTAETLREKGVVSVTVAGSPDEIAMAEAVLRLTHKE
ncbi:MAG: uroporphyrinogen-III synthase [Saprospiraceae bacterium]|nr:uroporphyrinogen-III synthase [Saprospiraceae bacterium]